jgi:hypothetical protein
MKNAATAEISEKPTRAAELLSRFCAVAMKLRSI